MRTTKCTIAVIVASTLALGSGDALVAADWPSFRGPNHDGKSAETITWPKDGPKQLWKINVGIGHSAVSVVGDRAYTMGNTDDIDTIFSIDARCRGRNASRRSCPWRLTEKGDLVLAEASPNGYKEFGSAHVIETRAFTAPVFANGRVYVPNTVGDVLALDMTGK
jgi:hypothetical protein